MTVLRDNVTVLGRILRHCHAAVHGAGVVHWALVPRFIPSAGPINQVLLQELVHGELSEEEDTDTEDEKDEDKRDDESLAPACQT